MNYSILNNKIIIRKNNKSVSFSIKKLNDLLNNEILDDLTFEDLLILWKNFYGIPSNINQYLQKKIELYDKSSNVNSFIYKDSEYWFDKNTRLGLMNLALCSGSNMQIVIGNELIEVNTDSFKEFLTQLEVYAGKCFINTQKHLNAIKDLKSIEDISKYDYTTGYPEKIKLYV